MKYFTLIKFISFTNNKTKEKFLIHLLRIISIAGLAFIIAKPVYAASLSINPVAPNNNVGLNIGGGGYLPYDYTSGPIATISQFGHCGEGKYRIPLNETYNGIALDLHLEVLNEDTARLNNQCVSVDNTGRIFFWIAEEQGTGKGPDGIAGTGDDNDPSGHMNLRMTIVDRSSPNTAPVPVTIDRFSITGFDLDGNGGATDDIYFLADQNTRAYLSPTTDVTLAGTPPGTFYPAPTDSFNAKAIGKNTGCNDSATPPGDPDCRATGLFVDTSTMLLRIQNDDLLTAGPRFFLLSLIITDFEALTVGANDYGDTPNTHPEGSTGIGVPLGLGNGFLPDAETAQQFSVDADGDDTDSLAQGLPSDENGVFLSDNTTSLSGQSVISGQSTGLGIKTFGSGFLNAWVDWNHDGDFDDTGERIANNQNIVNTGEFLANGSINPNATDLRTTTALSLAVPTTALPGKTYARFKFTETAISDAGLSNVNGEVEDYAIIIPATISGTVKDTANAALSGVTLTLKTATGITVNDLNGDPLITTTLADGSYKFLNVPVGEYFVYETDPANYVSTADADNSADGDTGTNTSQTDNSIPVTVTAGKDDKNNDFVDKIDPTIDNEIGVCTATGATSGDIRWDSTNVKSLFTSNNPTPFKVTEDTVGVTSTYENFSVQNPNGTPLIFPTGGTIGGDTGVMAMTQAPTVEGQYIKSTFKFDKPLTGIAPTLTDVDADLLSPGFFRDVVFIQGYLAGIPVQPTTISHGSANAVTTEVSPDLAKTSCQTGGNNANLQASATNVCFYGLEGALNTSVAGNVRVKFDSPVDEIVITFVTGDFADGDINNISDAPVFQLVFVGDMCWDGTTPEGSVSGTVKDSAGAPLSGNTVQIQDASGTVINDINGDPLTTTTLNDGSYAFVNVPVGEYFIVEIDSATYISTSDGDSSADGDATTNTSQIDNKIPVTITHAKEDDNNDFVDTLKVTGMTLTKVADVTTGVTANQTVTYTYVAKNTGNVVLTNITVSDVHGGTGVAPVVGNEVLTNTSTLSADAAVNGSVDTLAPGDEATFTSTYVVTQADIDAGTDIVNTATTTGTPPSGAPPLDLPLAKETVKPVARVTAMTLSKVANVTTGVTAGQTVTYTYVAKNTGNVVLTDVSVSDVHGGTGTAPVVGNEVLTNTSTLSIDVAVNGSVDTLAPGDEATFTSTYVVTQADIDAGTDIVNTATSTGTPPSGAPPLDLPLAKETVKPVTQVTAMTLDKTANDTTDVTVGQTIIYTYIATNTGNVNISNVSVSDVHSGVGTAPVVGNEALTNTSGLSGDAVTNAVIDLLAPGDKATFTATYFVTQADIDAGTDITNTATATGTPPSSAPPLTDPKDTETVELVDRVTTLTIVKKADDTTDVVAGQTIEYSYLVKNTGNVTVDNVTINDVHNGLGAALVDGNEALLNFSGDSADATANDAKIDALAPNDFAKFVKTYVVTQADVDAGVPITNIAKPTGTPPSGAPNLVPPSDNESVTPVARVTAMTLSKTANDTSNVIAGQTITYTYVAKNTGNVVLTNVTVSDVHIGTGIAPVVGNEVLTNTSTLSIDAAVNGSVDTLAPGDIATFTSTYVVTQADIDAGTDITNTATGTGTPPTGSPPLDPPTDGEIVKPIVRAPAMTLTKTANDTTAVTVGQTITYTYVAKNTGNVALTNVTVNDVHNGSGIAPVVGNEALTNTSTLSIDASQDGSVDTLSPGDEATFTSTYVVTQADIDAGVDITNIATGDGTPPTGVTPLTKPIANEAVTQETRDPKMTIDKTADITTGVIAGQTITYTYVVTNTGNVAINNVSVADVHQGTGTAPVAGNEVITNTSGLSVDTSVNGNVDSLAPGDIATFKSTYVVTQADITAGSAITNIATANGTPPSGSPPLSPPNNNESVTPVTRAPAMTITKLADNTTGVVEGQTITYNYVVTNTGNVPLTAVSVSDQHTSATGTAALTVKAETITTNTSNTLDLGAANDGIVDVLGVGDVATLTSTYVVTQADIDSGADITNIATGNATPPTGTSGFTPPTANEVVEPIARVKSMTLTKTADDKTDVVAGQTITYDYVVTNTGNVALTAVSIADLHTTSVSTSAIAVAGEAINTNASGSLNLGTVNDGNVDVLGVGDVATFTSTYVVTQTDIDAGNPITNIATGTATPPSGMSPIEVVANESVTTATIDPKITLKKTAGTPTVLLGSNATVTDTNDTITYTLLTTNSGNVTLSNVTVSDNLVTISSCANTSNGDAFTNSGTENLDIGESVSCTAVYTLVQTDIDAGKRDNTATVNAKDPTGAAIPPDSDNVSTPLQQETSITLVKSSLTPTILQGADSTIVDAGDTIAYTFDVTNTSNVSLTNIVVTDQTLSMTLVCTGGGATIPSLAAGANAQCTATYTLTQNDINGLPAYSTVTNGVVEITNNASVIGTPPAGSGLASPTATSTSQAVAQVNAALTLDKSASVVADIDNDGFNSVGDEITYTYTIKNAGNTTLKDVKVLEDGTAFTGTGTDPSPVNETSTNVSGLSTDATNNGSWDSLEPDDEVVFTAVYVLTQLDVDSGQIDNTAKVVGTPPMGVSPPPESTSSVIVPIVAKPSMTITKTADDTTDVMLGQLITYTHVVTNTGNVTLKTVSVDDQHSSAPGTVTLAVAGETITTNSSTLLNLGVANDGTVDVLGPNDVVTFTSTYTITQADIDAGSDITNSATANGTPPTGVPALTPPKAKEVVKPVARDPKMLIAKVASDTTAVVAGQVITYTYTLTNTGNVALTAVSVNDQHISTGGTITLPVSGESITSNISGLLSLGTTNDGVVDVLGPKDVVTFTATYTVTQADIDAGLKITNTATGNATPPTGLPPITPPKAVVEVVPAPFSPAMTISKVADDTTAVTVGQTINYGYTVENTGNVTFKNVLIDDQHTSASGTVTLAVVGEAITTNTSGTLDLGVLNNGVINVLGVGDIASFTSSYVVTQADIDAGADITNIATAKGTPPVGSPPWTEPQANETVVPQPRITKLTIDKTADITTNVVVGQTITYSYKVKNIGNVVVSNVTVSDVHSGSGIAPAPGNEVLTINTNGVSNDSAINGSIDALAPGDSATFKSTYIVTQADIDAGSDITNKATANGTPPTGAPVLTPPSDVETVTVITRAPKLSIDKIADDITDVVEGQTITYTYVVTNTGNVTFNNVSINDQHISAAGTVSLAVADEAITTNTSGLLNLGTVNDGTVDVLGIGDVVTFTSTYLVTQADIDAGSDIKNTATANGTPPVGSPPFLPPTDIVIIKPLTSAPAMEITKTANDTTDVVEGQIITYTYGVKNTGNVTLKTVSVDDQHTSSTGTAALAVTGEVATTNTSGLLALGTANDGVVDVLGVGDVVTFTSTYTVTQADITAGNDITNIATAIGKPPTGSPVLVPPTAKESVDLINPEPSIEIVKSLGSIADTNNDGATNEGDTITYNFVVTNTGDLVLNPIKVTDTKISNVTCDSTVLAVGASTNCTGNYVITITDMGVGGVENTATAIGTPKNPDGSDGTPVTDKSDAGTNPDGTPVTDPKTTETASPLGENPNDSNDPQDDPTTVTLMPISSISLIKSLGSIADTNGDGVTNAGDTITYNFTVVNTGDLELNDIVVTDAKITTINCDATTLAVSKTTNCSGNYVILGSDMSAGGVENTAKVSATPKSPDGSDSTTPVTDISDAGTKPDHTPVTDSGNTETPNPLGDNPNNATDPSDDPTTVNLTPIPSIEIVKSLGSIVDTNGDGVTNAGDTIKYTFDVSNTGDLVLNNVSVTDTKIANVICMETTLAVNGSTKCSGDYVILAADMVEGGVENIAKATGTPINPDGSTGTTVTDKSDAGTTPDGTPVTNPKTTETPNPLAENPNDQNDPTDDPTTVSLKPNPPVAVDDEKLNQPLGQPVTIQTLLNDSDPDKNIDPTTVKLVDPSGSPVTTLVVPNEGEWKVDAVTGDITFTPNAGFVSDPTPVQYTVKDLTGLESNKATVKIDYEPAASLTGTVWLDNDKDGVIDSTEDRKAGWTLKILDKHGNLVTTTTTDANGEYDVTGLIPGEYTVEFYMPNGVLMSTLSTNGPIAAGQKANLPLPIDPSGVFYDSVTRQTLSNVKVQLVNSSGAPVADVCLGAGQQNQVTLADGLYQFDVTPGAHTSCPDNETYSLKVVSVPAGYFTDSTIIPAETGTYDGDANEGSCTQDSIPNSGSCEVQAQPDAPTGNEPTAYFMDFLLNAGDKNIIFNHIPLDAQLSRKIDNNAIVLTKSVSKKQVSVGDQLYYTIVAENTSNRDLDIDIRDDLPTGFKFTAGKAKLVKSGADGVFDPADYAAFTQVSSTGFDPVRFGVITVPANEKVQIGYLLKVGTGVPQGNAINKARAFATGSLTDIASNLATAQVVVVADPVLDDATLIGKVFHDRDSDGYQDDANATGIMVKSDYFGWNSLHIGNLKGRVSVLDDPAKHRKIIRMPYGKKRDFKVTTKQGTLITVDNSGQVIESHIGDKARGLTAQEIEVTTRRMRGIPTPTKLASKRVAATPTDVLEITITNMGIHEEGIPGVRLATVKGLLIETDGYGRYHIPDVDGGRRYGMGKNFILKVDKATLPEGSRFTTENPRVLRLTGSALNKINFGVKLPVQAAPQRHIQQGAKYRTETRKHVTTKQVPVYKSVDVTLGSIFFDKDKHNVRADQRGNMSDIANKIKRYGRGHIIIDAFTDSRHNAKYNIALAKRRANTVRVELQKRLGSKLMRHVKVEVDQRAYTEVPHNDPEAIDYKGSQQGIAF